MKKWICALLALCMAFSLLPFGALAAEDDGEPVVVFAGTCGKTCTFEVTSDGVMTVRGTGKVGKRKTTYTNKAYTQRVIDEKLVISEGITEIGEDVFNGVDVKEIVLPDSLKRIGRNAFITTWFVESITFGSGLETIDEGAFQSCSVRELILPESLKTIGNYAFSGCYKLRSAVIFGEVGYGSFSECRVLESAAVMNATELGEQAFANCPMLHELYLSDTIDTIGAALTMV